MPLNEAEEERLILAMRAGEEAALAEVIRRYTPYAGAVVWGILQGKRSEEDAKELLADSFYTLWQNADKVRPGSLKGYLAAIARSKARNALRKAGRELSLEEDGLNLILPGPEDETARQEEYAALRRCLDALPEPDRTIFLRHYYLYQSAREIGEALQLNVNTVHTKLRRGRERLRQELTKGGFTLE